MCTTRLLKISTSNRGSPPAFVVCVCVLYEVLVGCVMACGKILERVTFSVFVVVVVVIIMILIVCACTIFE